MTTHRVQLSNGEVLLVEERDNYLSLALEEKGFPGCADMWVCQISADGVLVMPNSGYATEYLSKGLK